MPSPTSSKSMQDHFLPCRNTWEPVNISPTIPRRPTSVTLARTRLNSSQARGLLTVQGTGGMLLEGKSAHWAELGPLLVMVWPKPLIMRIALLQEESSTRQSRFHPASPIGLLGWLTRTRTPVNPRSRPPVYGKAGASIEASNLKNPSLDIAYYSSL